MDQLLFILNFFLTDHEQELFKAAVKERHEIDLEINPLRKKEAYLEFARTLRARTGDLKQASALASRLMILVRQLPSCCPVCSLPGPAEQGHICWCCGWERCPIQDKEPDTEGGPNLISLREYKEVFNKHFCEVQQ